MVWVCLASYLYAQYHRIFCLMRHIQVEWKWYNWFDTQWWWQYLLSRDKSPNRITNSMMIFCVNSSRFFAQTHFRITSHFRIEFRPLTIIKMCLQCHWHIKHSHPTNVNVPRSSSGFQKCQTFKNKCFGYRLKSFQINLKRYLLGWCTKTAYKDSIQTPFSLWCI